MYCGHFTEAGGVSATGRDLEAGKSSTSVLRELVTGAAVAQNAGWTASQRQAAAAAAHGEVCNRAATNSYSTHPAALDATLHLGACLAAVESADSTQDNSKAVILRVPSALAAFWAGGARCPHPLWAKAGDVSLQAGDSALSSYWLASASGSASMQDLLAKPMTAKSPAAAPKSSRSTSQSMLYSLHWKAAEATPAGLARCGMPLRHGLAWRAITAGESETLLLRAQSVTTAVQATSASLVRIQQALAVQSSKPAGLQLQICGVLSSGPGPAGHLGSAVAAAGASGLLRTAAQEYPPMQWQAHISDVHASRTRSHVLPAITADAFGIKMSAGVACLPQMLPAEPLPAEDIQARRVPLAGRVIISGGLGGIGALLAAWAGQNPDLHVHLLGRNGHVPPAMRTAVAGMRHVTVSRCDVSASEDALALAHAASDGPLRQIWHAGGLLQDGLLPAQTAAAMRAAAAPKLAGAVNLSAAARGSPLQNMALFSSTAALLGPAGQANYAAANSQLNAWALHAQATGVFIFS